jgi:D-alanine-D-alanine ligase
MQEQRRIRLAVLFGGRSGEHEVSLMSAASVIGAVDHSKYEVIPIGITKEGRWLAGGDPMAVLSGGRLHLPLSGETADAPTVPGTLLPEPGRHELLAVDAGAAGVSTRLGSIDVVFPVLHGTYGEDGTVQGLLELAGIPYVGSGVVGSAAGMDKIIMKALFRDAGLPVLDCVVVQRRALDVDPQQCVDEVERRLAYPCFVKPANLGSSVGISKVRRRSELLPALQQAARYDRKLLVEAAAVDFREVEVSVLGNDAPLASVPGEIVPAREFYDYEAKYVDTRSELFIPARISPECVRRVQEMAVTAFQACDCAGLARVDFFVARDTCRVWVNEINTMPGFTKISMYPKLWEASGLAYSELIDRLVELAMERHRERARSQTSYE